MLSMEFPIRNCLPFFFQTDGNFYQSISSHTQGRCPNKSLVKKIQMPSEIKLLAGTKIYYCLNSKGDNFKVNQLLNATKNKLYVRDRMSCSIFNVRLMALKITCSNPRFTLDFVRKCLFCAFNESTDNSKED